MQYKNRNISFVNIIIFITVTIYSLDKYLPSSGYINFNTNLPDFIAKMLGFCGGDLMYFLGDLGTSIEDSQYWRLITFLFLHMFSLHLLVNMLALYKVGHVIEKEFGYLPFIVLYFGIGIVTQLLLNALQIIWGSHGIAVGASGAIFGLMGFCFYLAITKKKFIKINFSKRWIFYYIFYGIVFTYPMGKWTYTAHNIGFIIGFILAAIIAKLQISFGSNITSEIQEIL